MNFLSNLSKATNRTTTENGAETLLSSQHPLVDFFGLAGATRQNPELGLDLFKKALAFDKLGAVRLAFYLRDVRGGQGERQLFRNCLHYMMEHERPIIDSIIKHVPEYGRWDDLLTLQHDVIVPMIRQQLKSDMVNDRPSLLGKWLPSENTSSRETVRQARELAKSLGMTAREYRKTLSTLRKKIGLVEQKMSANKWKEIDYSIVPSQANLKYRGAFAKHDADGYESYLESVSKGGAKMNSGTLYPYQIYKINDQQGADEMWKSLPDYTQGKNALVIADVSGSMEGDPMAVSVSLALYFAERNKGIFKDYFMTFSDKPLLQKVIGSTLRDKCNSIEKSEWGMSTNISLALRTIADASKQSPEDVPETLYIISDMEFNACTSGTNFDYISAYYKTLNLKLPNVVFWNVNARNKQVPIEYNKKGVTLVSGLSPSTFKLVVDGKTPLDLVNDVINSDRYNVINI